jgi:hypothetical protein
MTLPTEENYGEQLRRWTHALATGDVKEVSEAIAEGGAEDIRRFLENCAVERHQLLRQELALVALAFDDFDEAIAAYLRQVPPAAYDPMYSDRERFLRWLQTTRPLTAQQRNFIAYQQAEYAVRALACRRRAEHLAFQRLRASGVDVAAAERLHLNPIRVWARLALPGRTIEDAIFFATGERIAVTWLELPALELVHRLAAGDGSLEVSSASSEEFMAVSRDLVTKGLLACT